MPRHPVSKEFSFLLSALTEENRFRTTEEFLKWFKSREQANKFSIKPIRFDELDKWYFDEKTQDLAHTSGRFFRVEGLRVKANFGSVKQWDQPIMNQPEIGILGIVTRVFDGVSYFLMQAKMEPGNVNILQLSPTVQATYSNFTQVHKGLKPRYLEYFLDRTKSKVLIDQLQSEQGTFFLKKRNRNMIVEVDEDLLLHDDFCWLTLGQIKKLSAIPNFVNMDSRSVLSCLPFIDDGMRKAYEAGLLEEIFQTEPFKGKLHGFSRDLFISMASDRHGCYSTDEILSWFTEFKTRFELKIEYIPLKSVYGWIRTDREIAHESGEFFSIIAVSVEAGNREVSNWTQPLVKPSNPGITGFLTKKINGVLHFLVQARLEPGALDMVEMGPTLSCREGENSIYQTEKPPFLDIFLDPLGHKVRYSAVQSTEGGRFYQDQNKYMIIELESGTSLKIPENYIWMTLGQIMGLIRYNNFINIEARELIACLSFLQEG